jgi:hypothetical protein
MKAKGVVLDLMQRVASGAIVGLPAVGPTKKQKVTLLADIIERALDEKGRIRHRSAPFRMSSFDVAVLLELLKEQF